MAIINTGKCQSCDKVVHSVEIEAMNITENFRPKWHGVSYVCPHCHALLGVGIDPLALKADMVKDIVKALKGR